MAGTTVNDDPLIRQLREQISDTDRAIVESLNARLRVAVCRGDIPVEVAQKQIATDWFALWVRLSA